MNIKRAKEEIKDTIAAYLLKDEFGEYKDKDTISPSVLSEHAKLLAKDNASEIISGYFNTNH